MKLSKDQKQKLALGSIFIFGVIYAYFEFLLGPLQAAKANAASTALTLEPKIAAAKAQLKKVADLKTKQPEAQRFMQQIISSIFFHDPELPTKHHSIFFLA